MQIAAAARAQTDAQSPRPSGPIKSRFTAIRSPVDGIAGLATAQVGDLVGPTTGVLTTVSKVNPIKAYFTVSDQRYTAYTKKYADPTKRAAHEKQLEFELILSDGAHFPQKGELFAAQNQVDVRTGSVRIAAIFPNPGNILRPGQFALVRARTDVRNHALLVPQRAVIELQGSYQVAVVGADNKVHIQPVTMGRRIDSNWIVEGGPHQQKVREGAPVNPNRGLRRLLLLCQRVADLNAEVLHQSADRRDRHGDPYDDHRGGVAHSITHRPTPQHRSTRDTGPR